MGKKHKWKLGRARRLARTRQSREVVAVAHDTSWRRFCDSINVEVPENAHFGQVQVTMSRVDEVLNINGVLNISSVSEEQWGLLNNRPVERDALESMFFNFSQAFQHGLLHNYNARIEGIHIYII
jgi:hypothetical protein